MPNPDFGMLGIDLNALKNHMEGQLLCTLIKMNPDITEKQQKQLRAALAIFEQHGIGAIEALDIMRGISEVYNDQT